jgi:hypothetical protein
VICGSPDSFFHRAANQSAVPCSGLILVYQFLFTCSPLFGLVKAYGEGVAKSNQFLLDPKLSRSAP